MQTTRRCWKCGGFSRCTEYLPGIRPKHLCPKCGVEAWEFVPSEQDKRLGTPYFNQSTGTVMRCGRERFTLLGQDRYMTDLKKTRVDYLDAWIPST